jgi:hypothetical protein
LTLQSTTDLAGVRGESILGFLAMPDDASYQRWWPGTHLRFHTVRGAPGRVGSIVYVDEWVGRRRLRGRAILTELVPGKRMAWRVRAPLPIVLSIEVEDRPGLVRLTHTLRVGFRGLGAALDPLLRLYADRSFERALDEHVRAELAKLAELLRSDPSARSPGSRPMP